MTPLELRPLSLGEILDRTFSLYRRRFALFVGISAVPGIVLLAGDLIPMGALVSDSAAATLSTLLSVLVTVASWIGYLLCQGATTLAVADLHLGRDTTIAASLKRLRRRLLPLTGTAVLGVVLIGLGTLLLVIPGVIFVCRLFVAAPATLIERHGPTAALARSSELVKGFGGRALVILLAYFILDAAAHLLLGWPFLLMGVRFSGDDGWIPPLWLALYKVGYAIAGALSAPFLFIAISVFYFDLRVRKEAFDLQLLADPNSESVAALIPGSPLQP